MVRKLTKTFPAEQSARTALFDVLSLNVKKGEFICLFGPNGCGKSTLVRILMGLEPYDSGEILIGGRLVTGANTLAAMVPQGCDLFDWKTVLENVEFGLKARGVSEPERQREAQRYIELVRLTGHENKYPRELSGGLRQRCAIARALVLKPAFLVMDEPFSALDISVRRELQELLLDIYVRHALTVFFITHDLEEAVLLSSRVLVLGGNPARIVNEVQIDLPHPRQWNLRFQPEFQAYLQLF